MSFKIRASQAHKLMTSPRTKAAKESGELSETAKTYCQEWIKEQLYGRHKEIMTKQMQKGILQEDIGIDFFADYSGAGLLLKNEKHFSDQFMTGMPDILQGDLLADIKCSWDWSTFPLFMEEVPKEYFYQLQVYMHLTGVHKSKLVYVLLDTPEHLIEKECYYYCSTTGYSFEEKIEEFKAKMTYSDVEDRLRIKIFGLDFDGAVIDLIKEQVNKCRKYIEAVQISL